LREEGPVESLKSRAGGEAELWQNVSASIR
jgi:hypothetical protein